MTRDEIKAKIEIVWDFSPIKTDWLGLEHCLRSILREKTISPTDALLLIDDAIAAYTGRGNQLEQPFSG